MIVDVPLKPSRSIILPPRPPFKWAGSKSRMLVKYYNAGFLPPTDPKMFVDMFAGSCVVSLWVRQLWPDIPIVINDLNSEMIQMYQEISKNLDSFISHFKGYVERYSVYETIEDKKKFYYELRDDYRFFENGSPTDESALLLFLLKTNFNGIWQTMKSSGGRHASPAGNMKSHHSAKVFQTGDIKKFSEFLNTCILTCEPYESTVKWINEKTWMYADPPYRISHATYKAAGQFDDDDQINLINLLRDASKRGSYIALSNREHLDGTKIKWSMTTRGRDWISGGFFGPHFPESDYTMTMFTNHKYTAGRHNKGSGAKSTEILIKNY